MSKKLTGVITAALIVGAMGTTFAASNPFSDVPSGHWSYQAVTKLAQAGVIEGYGDGTFKGDKSIRYLYLWNKGNVVALVEGNNDRSKSLELASASGL